MSDPIQVFVPAKIVSGGQTGVDRGALEAAIALGIEHGGWCPAGRIAEDGTIPSRYTMLETASSDYPARTKQNVIDSDATLILFQEKVKGGTLLTKRVCKSHRVPHLLIRLDHPNDEELQSEIDQARDWLQTQKPKLLNVAGPRESNFPGIEKRSLDFLLRVFAH